MLYLCVAQLHVLECQAILNIPVKKCSEDSSCWVQYITVFLQEPIFALNNKTSLIHFICLQPPFLLAIVAFKLHLVFILQLTFNLLSLFLVFNRFRQLSEFLLCFYLNLVFCLVCDGCTYSYKFLFKHGCQNISEYFNCFSFLCFSFLCFLPKC